MRLIKAGIFFSSSRPGWPIGKTFGAFHLANLLMVRPYFIESAAFIEVQLAKGLNRF